MRVALGWMAAALALLMVPVAASSANPALVILATVILALALLRTADPGVLAAAPRRVAGRFLASVAVASIIVLGSVAGFGATLVILDIIDPGSGCVVSPGSGNGREPNAFSLLAQLLGAVGVGSLLKRWLWSTRPAMPGHEGGTLRAGRARHRSPGLSVGKVMTRVAAVAIYLALLRAATPRKDEGWWSESFHGSMHDFCLAEADLFESRAGYCRSREADGVPWDDPGQNSELLRNGPYPWDQSLHGSWAEQAEVWRRAADQARRMAQWHASR